MLHIQGEEQHESQRGIKTHVLKRESPRGSVFEYSGALSEMMTSARHHQLTGTLQHADA